jgi:plastocyanin
MRRIVPLLACALVALGALPLAAATVSGKISFVTKRGQNPVVNETLVWLEPVGKNPRKPPQTFQMMTRGKALIPHVLAVPAGSTVQFPNDDPISHNLFSLSPNNSFDLGLYRKGAGKAHKFDATGVVNVYCNVHPNMSAVVHVMSSPYYTFADPSGNYAIGDVPPGKYRLTAWNEQGGQTTADIEVSATGAIRGTLALTLDSRNYRVTQHLDKNGKRYQAPKEY